MRTAKTGSSATFLLRILLLHCLLVLAPRSNGVLAQDALADELLRVRAVRDLIVERVGEHMFLELLAKFHSQLNPLYRSLERGMAGWGASLYLLFLGLERWRRSRLGQDVSWDALA